MVQIDCFKIDGTVVKASGKVVLFPRNLASELFWLTLALTKYLLKVVPHDQGGKK